MVYEWDKTLKALNSMLQAQKTAFSVLQVSSLQENIDALNTAISTISKMEDEELAK